MYAYCVAELVRVLFLHIKQYRAWKNSLQNRKRNVPTKNYHIQRDIKNFIRRILQTRKDLSSTSDADKHEVRKIGFTCDPKKNARHLLLFRVHGTDLLGVCETNVVSLPRKTVNL